MGVITDEQELISSIPPAKLFKSFIIDADNLLPKILPGAFKSFETLEGDGGVGTIKLITFNEGVKYKFAKHRTDGIDEANCVFKYSLIEGENLGEDFERISYVIKVENGPNGGSVFKSISTFHCKGDDQNIIQEKIKEGREGTKAFFHAVEAYLHGHPHEYN